MSSRHPHLVRLVGLVVAGVVLAVGTATAASDRPAQGIKADGLRLQGIAQVYRQLQDRPAASFYSPLVLASEGQRLQGIAQAYERMQGLTADGLRLQGIAQVYEGLGRPAASFYTPQALKAQGLRWQGMAQAYAADATAAGSSSSSSNGFDWGAAFIGAASMLGLATVGVALLLGAHRVRRTKVAV
jgi:hypothetical protein